MNRMPTALRIFAAVTALSVTFAIVQAVSASFTAVPAAMAAKLEARHAVLAAE